MLFARIEHDGSTIEFDHSQIAIEFCYKIDDPSFRARGPFATWTIDISEIHNEGLSIECVTDAYLEFVGQFEGSRCCYMSSNSRSQLLGVLLFG